MKIAGKLAGVQMKTKYDKDTGEYREAKLTITFTDRDLPLFAKAMAALADLAKGSVAVELEPLTAPLPLIDQR